MQNVTNQVMNTMPQTQQVVPQYIPVYPCIQTQPVQTQYVQPYIYAQPQVMPPQMQQPMPPMQQQNGACIPVTAPPSQPTAPQSSGVNIIIYNPSVNPAASTIANSNNTYSTPTVAYPYNVNGMNGSSSGNANATAAAGLNPNNPYNNSMAYPSNYYTQEPKKTSADEVANSYIASTEVKEKEIEKAPEPKKEEETHKEKIVQLTDDYIRTLENYLNNPNTKVREMGIKEVMDRFKEHKSRYTDIALTNLLNKALQDKAKTVRFVALATLDAEFARGDDFTVKILNNMQSSSAVYGEDAIMAAEILLKMSRRQVEVTVPGPKPEDKKKAN